jgi:hypothetical protein
MDPPSARRPAVPLGLSVSLGEVRTLVDGHRVALTDAELRAIDADFIQAARASGLFRDVRPQGSRTELTVDTVRQLYTPPLGIARTAYLVFTGPLPLLAPGFPYPWDYRIGREVRLHGDVKGTTFHLADRSATYDQRVWGATYWGGRSIDPLRQSEGRYLVALVAEALADGRNLFDGFESAVRAGDVEAAWLLSVQAAATAPPR